MRFMSYVHSDQVFDYLKITSGGNSSIDYGRRVEFCRRVARGLCAAVSLRPSSSWVVEMREGKVSFANLRQKALYEGWHLGPLGGRRVGEKGDFMDFVRELSELPFGTDCPDGEDVLVYHGLELDDAGTGVELRALASIWLDAVDISVYLIFGEIADP